MNAVIDFIKKKSVGYWLMAGAFVCGLVAMIMFFATSIPGFARIYGGATGVGFVVFVVLAAAMLVYELRIVKYLTAATGLYMFAMYIVCEVRYIANYFTSIDPTPLYGSYVVILVFSIVAFGLATASACMADSGLAREKKNKSAKKTEGSDVSEGAKA